MNGLVLCCFYIVWYMIKFLISESVINKLKIMVWIICKFFGLGMNEYEVLFVLLFSVYDDIIRESFVDRKLDDYNVEYVL